jgi:hypothetical protein
MQNTQIPAKKEKESVQSICGGRATGQHPFSGYPHGGEMPFFIRKSEHVWKTSQAASPFFFFS